MTTHHKLPEGHPHNHPETPAELLTPFAHQASNRCFGCGPANPSGLNLKFQLAPDLSVVCLAEVSDHFEGHPGYLHGGVIATLLDEAMSKSVRARNALAMTRELKVDYLRPVPSCKPIRIEGWIVKHEGRKFWAEAAILDEHRTRLAEGSGVFIEIKPRPT
ncbi:MAG: PaaI family thioesterase [Terracidiphilus sp.]